METPKFDELCYAVKTLLKVFRSSMKSGNFIRAEKLLEYINNVVHKIRRQKKEYFTPTQYKTFCQLIRSNMMLANAMVEDADHKSITAQSVVLIGLVDSDLNTKKIKQ